MLKCISYKRAKKYDNLCEEISKMYTFLLFKNYFFGLLGGEGRGRYESPFTPDKWAKEKNTASLARGIPTKGDLTDSAPEHVSKLHGRWNHSE
jgi:hypothetical protein